MSSFDASSGRIERLVIVGGGTAGWMSAIYLNRVMREYKAQVVLVESPTLGTIGVGEATIPSLVHFFRGLKIDEREMMRRCSATFKVGIKFEDWSAEGETYWHPFGPAGARIDNLDLFHFWMKRRLAGGTRMAYADYSAQVQMAEGDKAPRPIGGNYAPQDLPFYAYHLDAAALAEFLRETATREGVQHLFGDVKDAALDGQGNIETLDIGGDRRISGDFFIDATGFSGRLIEKCLGDPWIDWSRYMLCDTAVTMPLPRSERFPSYTRSSAMEAGWRWEIPLSHRTGSGYVFSSAHLSLEAATDALIARSGLRKASAADPRALSFRVGRRANFWARNCVSVGLSSGFIEPLESTGIHLIQQALMLLVEHFPDKAGNDSRRRAFNARMEETYNRVRDFIVLHYLLSRRKEPFWRDSRYAPVPDSLRELLELYDEAGRIDASKPQLFPDTSFYFILAGNGRLPAREIVEAAVAPEREVWLILDRVRAEAVALARRLPSHKDYLTDLHRTPI